MPFEIVRNDITEMQVDAIVNTTSVEPGIGSGVDAQVHRKAGPKLLEARKKAGRMKPGQAFLTPGFGLEAKHVIHVLAPTWTGGGGGEEELLAASYRNTLELAEKSGCESVAFPLLSAGNRGFPESIALQIAIREFSTFLMDSDLHIYLAVFNRQAFRLSEKLFHSVSAYIDETFVDEVMAEEYGTPYRGASPESELGGKEVTDETLKSVRLVSLQREEALLYQEVASLESVDEEPASSTSADSLESILQSLDAGFSETLLRLIDRTGKKDSEIYKKANVDRKLFSKIRNNLHYKPSKSTALAFAIALELNLEETEDFIARAGYALSHSSKFDIIIEYFILQGNYNIFEINEVLFAFDQPLIGA